jgi:hypothetical protein
LNQRLNQFEFFVGRSAPHAAQLDNRMDAQATTRRLDLARAAFPTWSQLAQAVASSLLALLALAGLLICIRRVSGALVEPLPAPLLVGLGGLLALAAVAFRAAFRAAHRRGSLAALYSNWAAPSAVLMLWAAGLSSHETSSGGLIGLWGLLLAEESWSWGRVRQNSATPKEPNDMAMRGSVTLSQPARSGVGTTVLGAGDEEIEAISQQVVRRRPLDGSEAIEGWVRAEFSPGQRHGAAHIAICPPLDRVPQCFAEQMDGPAAQIKIAEVLPYGARFEIKLDKPAEQATSVIVEFSIHDRPVAQ